MCLSIHLLLVLLAITSLIIICNAVLDSNIDSVVGNILIDINMNDAMLLKVLANAEPHRFAKPSIKIMDKDKLIITIRKLDDDEELLESCYEASKDWNGLNGNEVEVIRFCFPSINVAGYQKCGTSSMYTFLSKGDHSHLAAADEKAKELCPNSMVVWKFFDFFKRLVPLYDDRHSKKYHVNGCIHEVQNLLLHYLLEPKTVYIMMIRNLVEQMWGAYNYWCKGIFENYCKGGFKSRKGMYRDPVMFDQLLMAANYELTISYDFIKSCKQMGSFYQDILAVYMNNRMNIPYIVMAMENFEDPEELHRLQHFLNRHLHSRIRFSSTKIPHINYNDHAIETVDLNITDLKERRSVYAISNYKPLLQQTRDYVQNCWHEDCLKMSGLSNYKYNCTKVTSVSGSSSGDTDEKRRNFR